MKTNANKYNQEAKNCNFIYSSVPQAKLIRVCLHVSIAHAQRINCASF